VKKAILIKKKHSRLLLLAEVVGSNPTQSTFINMVNYSINLSSISVIIGQNPMKDLIVKSAIAKENNFEGCVVGH
jgi:hypothetical protein